MVRPRWQRFKPKRERLFWYCWNRAIAVLATANFAWILFDITYIPLRTFWITRNFYPISSGSLVIPMKWLPNVTTFYDHVKGIKPSNETKGFIENLDQLNRSLNAEGINGDNTQKLRLKQVDLTQQVIEKVPAGSSEYIENHRRLLAILRNRAGMTSPKESSIHLLSKGYLKRNNWDEEYVFWERKVIPLMANNYSRELTENGKQIDFAWQIDAHFQLFFLLDILLRTLRLKKRFPGINWRDAFLRRWIDLPLFLPFWRPLRLLPVTERLCSVGMLQMEPLRAVVSRGVVALLALELFEVLTVQVLDGVQKVARSPQLPQRIRDLRSHQSIERSDNAELIELIRLWIPLLLTQVAPNMRSQLIDLFGHALKKSMEGTMVPSRLKELSAIQKAESALSNQLSAGMVDTLLGIAKNTGKKFKVKDQHLEQLSINTIDRFWEELARALESEQVLEESQELFIAFLENLKRSSFRELRNQGRVDELIKELDGLSFNSVKTEPKSPG